MFKKFLQERCQYLNLADLLQSMQLFSLNSLSATVFVPMYSLLNKI